jgi:hypothetical protein
MSWTTRALAFAGMFVLAGTAAQAGNVRPVVVELFTSQGCNSCPPADVFLGKLSQRSDVLALTLPVTYWDMLGWKDSLANEANTRRQKAYAAAMGHGGVYTPQIIVDGVQDVVGSRIANVEAAIEARSEAIEAGMAIAEVHNAEGTFTASRIASGYEPAAAPPPPHNTDPLVPVALNENGQELHINIGAVGGQHNATVWLLHLRSAVTVAIKAGENEGRSVTYHNVVGDIRAVGIWKGSSLSLTLPRSAMAGLPHDAVAVLVQHGGYGHVIGASYISHPEFYPSH